MVHAEGPETIMGLIPLCVKRVGKLEKLSPFICLCQRAPFGVDVELMCISSFKKSPPTEPPTPGLRVCECVITSSFPIWTVLATVPLVVMLC